METSSLTYGLTTPSDFPVKGMQDNPKIWLTTVPRVEIPPASRANAPDAAAIRKLIESLARPDIPPNDLVPCLSGEDFSPTGWWHDRSRAISPNVEGRKAPPPAPAFRRLVELGWRSIPALLENLDNTADTALLLPRPRVGDFAFRVDVFPFWSHPLNPAERAAMDRLKGVMSGYPAAGMPDADHYAVCLGDLCHSALGQIVSRRYSPVRPVPSQMFEVSSPARCRELREAVRSVWEGSKDPQRMLLDSLFRDFATRGGIDPDGSGWWYTASILQIEAVVRLLYYWSDPCAGFIARRLESLDVRKIGLPHEAKARQRALLEQRKQQLANGVDAVELIAAVRWSKHPAIRGALAKLARRTDDPTIRRLITGS